MENIYEAEMDEFHTLAKRIDELSIPDIRDNEYVEIVNYINSFLKYFGSERCMLSGSTAERTKLHTENKPGDADFLLISGVNIPEMYLEYRDDNPAYLRIHGAPLRQKMSFELVAEKYLPTSLLKEISPGAFQFLRSIFKIVTMPYGDFDQHSGTVDICEQSKVGVEYRGLSDFVFNSLFTPRGPTKYLKEERKAALDREIGNVLRQKSLDHHEQKAIQTLWNICDVAATVGNKPDDHRRTNVQRVIEAGALKSSLSTVHQDAAIESDADSIEVNNTATHDQSLLTDIVMTGTSHKPQKGGQTTHYIHQPTTALTKHSSARQKTEEEPEVENQECECVYNRKMYVDKVKTNVRVKARRVTSKDYVPVFPLKGKPIYMDHWLHRKRQWPSPADVRDIYDSELFVVAKPAPKKAFSEIDFRLSFSVGELKLFELASDIQKKCYRIVKACHKGLSTNDGIVTTYHWKTAFFWYSEQRTPESWTDANLFLHVVGVMEVLIDSFRNGHLQHYFLPANLFDGLGPQEITSSLSTIETLRNDPVQAMKRFLEECDADRVVETTISPESAWTIRHLSTDRRDIYGAKTVATVVEDLLRSTNDDNDKSTEADKASKSRFDTPTNDVNTKIIGALLTVAGEYMENNTVKSLSGEQTGLEPAGSSSHHLLAAVEDYLADDVLDRRTKKTKRNRIVQSILSTFLQDK